MLWQVSPDRAKQLKAITDEAKKADTLILATDPDREGEAISWHVQEVLRQKKALPAKVERVTFNAITKSAVTEAMKHPRALDEDLIDAYRARRALDYLVGFTLSPILWRKLPGAKSAGRVQSVALRLIVDREREIELFKPQEYWSVSAQHSKRTARAFTAPAGPARRQEDRPADDRQRRRGRCRQGGGRGGAVHRRRRSKPSRSPGIRRRRSPPRPCSRKRRASSALPPATRCGSPRASTRDGLITYMRTDGVDMAPEAISAARKAIANRYDAATCPTSRASIPDQGQERAGSARGDPPDRFHPGAGRRRAIHARLYELVYNRALASQMASARLERTTVELTDGAGTGRASRDRAGRALPRFHGAVRGRPGRAGG